MKYIGPHVSIGGGVENAPLNARQYGATAFGMFTKNQRQWYAPPLKEESIVAFQANCRELGYDSRYILPHDSYLINLGQPDKEKRAQSLNAFIDELNRCAQLGLTMLNFHPGSHLKTVSIEEDLKIIAACLREAVDEVPDVCAVIENTAGQGSNVGFAFEHLAELIALVDRPGRVGVCLDTCHTYAAGYDLATPEGYEKTFADFDRLVGFGYLRGMHLNDTRSVLGQHLDRHSSIGEGVLGMEFFTRLMRDPRFDDIPMVLETPEPERWAEEIKMLLELSKAE